MKKHRAGFTLIELLVVILIIGILAALLLPAIMNAVCSAKFGQMQHMVEGLTQALAMFETDNNYYPPGKGDGSKTLVDALAKKGARKMAYFEFKPDELDEKGNIMSKIRPGPGGDILYYRNNVGQKGPQIHNTERFDLWCRGCGTAPDEVRNW